MTLKEAAAAYIKSQGYTGVFFYGEQTSANVAEGIVIRDAGSHGDDPTRYFKYPTIEVIVSTKDQAGNDALTKTLAAAFDVGGAIALHPSYNVLRSVVPIPSASEGRDTSGIWTRSFSVNFLTHAAADI